MSVTPIRLTGWKGPGCGPDCLPRSHDPEAHERYGYDRALAEIRGAVIRTGNLVVDLSAATVHVDGVQVDPSDREWHVLEYLAARFGRPCRVADIAQAIYGDASVHERKSVNQICYKLRRRLDTAGRLITSGRYEGGPMRRLERVEVTG